MAVTSAINDLVSSIAELISSFFHGIYSLVSTVFSSIFGLITGFFNLIVDTISGVLSITAETGKFLVGNAVLLAILGFGVLVFIKYQNNQGRPVVVGNKKLA